MRAARRTRTSTSGSVNGTDDASISIGKDTISGRATSGRFCGARNSYRVYFSAKFDTPFESIGTWKNGAVTPGKAAETGGAKAKVAQPNGVDRASGQGGAAGHRQFHTSRYHSLVQPNVFSDADGQYIGFDGRIHKAGKGHSMYTNFSGWDIYRSEIPLLATIAPKETSDIVRYGERLGLRTLALLGSASNGNASGTLTVTYTDGSKSTATVGFSDWTLGGGGAQPAFGNRIVLSTPYRNASSGDPRQIRTMVFATAPVTLEAGKTVASVTLPSNVGGGALHVFAIAVGA